MKKIFFLFILVSALHSKANFIEELQKSIVSIQVNTIKSVNSKTGPSALGTGMIYDKKKGIILTNAHVVLPDSCCTYIIKFNDGTKLEAKYLYNDPYSDFAFIQIKKEDIVYIPKESTAIEVSKEVYRNQKIYVAANNAGFNHSLLQGYIAEIYSKVSVFPFQCITLTLNNTGGSSGSPVYNIEGKVIALVYAGNRRGTAFALPISYVVDAYDGYLKNKKFSVRKGLRHNINLVNIFDLKRYLNIPIETFKPYLKGFKSGRQEVIVVSNKFPLCSSPFKAGDIILSIDGVSIGPSIYKYDSLLQKDEVEIKILRQSNASKYKTIDITVKTSVLNNRIRRFLVYGGCVFFEEGSEYLNLLLGGLLDMNKKKRVYCLSYDKKGTLSRNIPVLDFQTSVCPFRVLFFHGKEVNSLEEMIKIIKNDFRPNSVIEILMGASLYVFAKTLSNFPQIKRIPVELNRQEPLFLYDYDDTTQNWDIKNLNAKN